MSNPLPKTEATPRRGNLPNLIEPELYQGLADLRKHCAREGQALIDRAYRDAQALHKRVRELEAELEMVAGPRRVIDAFPPRDVFGNPRRPSQPLVQRVDPSDPTTSTEDAFNAGEELL